MAAVRRRICVSDKDVLSGTVESPRPSVLHGGQRRLATRGAKQVWKEPSLAQDFLDGVARRAIPRRHGNSSGIHPLSGHLQPALALLDVTQKPSMTLADPRGDDFRQPGGVTTMSQLRADWRRPRRTRQLVPGRTKKPHSHQLTALSPE